MPVKRDSGEQQIKFKDTTDAQLIPAKDLTVPKVL